MHNQTDQLGLGEVYQQMVVEVPEMPKMPELPEILDNPFSNHNQIELSLLIELSDLEKQAIPKQVQMPMESCEVEESDYEVQEMNQGIEFRFK